jgi:hypothetical protein
MAKILLKLWDRDDSVRYFWLPVEEPAHTGDEGHDTNRAERKENS